MGGRPCYYSIRYLLTSTRTRVISPDRDDVSVDQSTSWATTFLDCSCDDLLFILQATATNRPPAPLLVFGRWKFCVPLLVGSDRVM